MKGRAVAEADAVICISQSTANDLQRLLNVPAEKIAVTHLGFSNVFAQVGSVAGGVEPRGPTCSTWAIAPDTRTSHEC